MGVGGPCNDLTAVVTFLISARFNYTVDEEGARPPLALAFPFRHPFVTASSSFPHQSLAQTRPVVLTRHRLANKIWLIALERFLLRSLLLSAEGEHRKKISESFLVIENLPLLRSRCDRGISDRDEFLSWIIRFLLLTIPYFFFMCVIIIRYIRFIKLVFCMIIVRALHRGYWHLWKEFVISFIFVSVWFNFGVYLL